MANVVYSVANDFGGDIDVGQFDGEVREDPALAFKLVGVTVQGDVVTVEFNSSLTTEEDASLDSLVSSHTPTVQLVEGSVQNALLEVNGSMVYVGDGEFVSV